MNFWSMIIPAFAVLGKINCISMWTDPAMKSDFENLPGKAKETVRLVTWYELLFSLTKEEALTTPPVTLADCFVKQVCASLAFQLACIHCSLLHMNLCFKEGLYGGGQLWHHADLLHWLAMTASKSRQHNVPRFRFSRGKATEPLLNSFSRCAA